jgi:hypothetical protein
VLLLVVQLEVRQTVDDNKRSSRGRRTQFVTVRDDSKVDYCRTRTSRAMELDGVSGSKSSKNAPYSTLFEISSYSNLQEGIYL